MTDRRTLIVDHPGWATGTDGAPSRVVLHEGTPWYARWNGTTVELRSLTPTKTAAPAARPALAHRLPPSAPEPLRSSLTELGTVVRLANPWLWEAITTAVLRQVVRAAQARALYRRWCSQRGVSYATPGGAHAVPPAPEVVLHMSSDAFAAVGAAFHRTALQAAARAYVEHADEWADLDAEDLVKRLEEIPRIGPWTASAAVADYTGDFSVYPHGDLAVLTWARSAAPDVEWPGNGKTFAAHWRRLAPERAQLHTLTLFTLAWGNHARTDEHDRKSAERC